MSIDKDFDTKMQVHYAEVGKLASVWAGFEHRIQWAIWNLASLDNLTGACITTQIGNSGRMIDAVIALLRLKNAPESSIKPLLKFAEKVARKQRQRNRIVHDPWSFRLPHGEAYRYELSAHRDVIASAIPHSTRELKDFTEEVVSLVDEFDALLSAIPMTETSTAHR